MKYTSVIIDKINHHHCHDSSQHRLKLVERNIYFDIKLRFDGLSEEKYLNISKCIKFNVLKIIMFITYQLSIDV